MNPKAILLAAILAAPALTAQIDDELMQQRLTFESKQTRTLRADYLLYLPKGYDAKAAKKWPLIVFLHGAGERGTNLTLVAVHGPPKMVKKSPPTPKSETAETRAKREAATKLLTENFIVISPQCLAGKRWDDDTVLGLIDSVASKHKVDASRVYLTGLSMGGYGSWSLGTTHPERFAAIAPICGGGDSVLFRLHDAKKAAALKSLPIWAFHGDNDAAVPVQKSEEMISALKKFGVAEARLTVYPGVGHDSWTESYNNPELYEWFLKHQR